MRSHVISRPSTEAALEQYPAGFITVGFTKPNRDLDYLPMSDGYQPEADQDEYQFPAPPERMEIEALAEMIFIASNAPSVCPDPARDYQVRLAALRIRSLSVGDTVRVQYPGEPAQMAACEPVGWRRVL